jgi:hypothetical protein
MRSDDVTAPIKLAYAGGAEEPETPDAARRDEATRQRAARFEFVGNDRVKRLAAIVERQGGVLKKGG